MPQRLQPLWPARLALAALLLVLLVLLIASLLLWQQFLNAQQQARIAECVGCQARSLARQLENNLNDQVEGLRRIADAAETSRAQSHLYLAGGLKALSAAGSGC